MLVSISYNPVTNVQNHFAKNGFHSSDNKVVIKERKSFGFPWYRQSVVPNLKRYGNTTILTVSSRLFQLLFGKASQYIQELNIVKEK